jgi:hypothetical protein
MAKLARYAPVGMTICSGRVHNRQTELSSRPKRTRISCHAALDGSACAPFRKGKAHEVHQRHQVPQEIRGSGVEGPAVSFNPITRGSMKAPPSPLSSRPERTRISCHAALDGSACAPFCKGKALEVHQRHQVPQEIRGSGVEGSAVQRVSHGNVFRPEPHVLEVCCTHCL